MANTVGGIHGAGDHSSRPAGNAVPDGSLYSCSTHSKIYQSSYAGNSWSDWASLSGSGMTDPMTTRGDIIIRDASNATARLARGAANTWLRSDGTDIAYAALPNGLWSMNKSSSQTLTSNADTLITFDTAVIGTDGTVIDLANDQFVAPATGLYIAFAVWLWETTAPLASGALACYINGSDNKAARNRIQGATLAGNEGANAMFPLSLAASDTVKLYIHPGGAVTPTARGNASAQIATAFTLIRIA